MTAAPFLTMALFVTIGFLSYANQMLPLNATVVETTSPTTMKFIDYNSSKLGFNVQHPANWNITEDQSGVWFVSPVDSTGNIRIERQPTYNQSLSDLVAVQLLQARESYKDLKVLSSNLTSLDGSPANRTDYQFKIEEPKFLGVDVFDFSAIQISTIKNGKFYTFTYFSNPDNFHIFLPIAQKMLSTLRLQ